MSAAPSDEELDAKLRVLELQFLDEQIARRSGCPSEPDLFIAALVGALIGAVVVAAIT